MEKIIEVFYIKKICWNLLNYGEILIFGNVITLSIQTNYVAKIKMRF